MYTDWVQQVMPYVKNAQMFTCPSNSGSPYVDTVPPNHDSYHGYGMNYWMTYYYYYHGLGSIQKPAETIWFTDCNFYVVYPTYYLYTYPTSTAYGQSGYARLQLRHNDGVNCGFIDGHAKWLNRQTIEGDIGLYTASTYWWGR